MITTLGDLLDHIEASPAVPEARKPFLRWALKRTRDLVGDGRADVPADPKVVLRRLARLSPPMAGMRPQSYANLKSQVRFAFRLAMPHLPPARSRAKLTGAWQALEAMLPRREQRLLSRFLRFCQAMGWQPDEIDEPRVQQFADYLENEAVIDDPEEVVRSTRRAWNHALDTVPGWPERRLAPPARKREAYWLRPDLLPASLQEEMADHLDRLANPTPFLAQTASDLAPTTIRQVRFALITLASALVAAGTPVEKLTSIAALVQPDHLKLALTFLYARAGNRITSQIESLAYRALRIATELSLPASDLAALKEILAMIRRESPGRRGLTDKNRRLLEHVEDPAFVDRLLALPARLKQAAMMSNRQIGPSCARDAIAVELLLTCSMRVSNLVNLRLGETIRKFGQGRGAAWVIEIPAEEVKNRQPLRYALLPKSGRLLEWYLADWHHRWCGHDTVWLFPSPSGKPTDPKVVSHSIAKQARRYVGVRVTAHQFRHLAAEIYLREDPNGLGVVSQHLGHRDLNTTRWFYAREQTRIATQRYHQVLDKKRSAAPSRLRKTRKPAA